jgi:hypothetical protein
MNDLENYNQSFIEESKLIRQILEWLNLPVDAIMGSPGQCLICGTPLGYDVMDYSEFRQHRQKHIAEYRKFLSFS